MNLRKTVKGSFQIGEKRKNKKKKQKKFMTASPGGDVGQRGKQMEKLESTSTSVLIMGKTNLRGGEKWHTRVDTLMSTRPEWISFQEISRCHQKSVVAFGEKRGRDGAQLGRGTGREKIPLLK